MKKIILILSLIVLTVCVILAGFIDSEGKRHLESTPKPTLQTRMIRH